MYMLGYFAHQERQTAASTQLKTSGLAARDSPWGAGAAHAAALVQQRAPQALCQGSLAPLPLHLQPGAGRQGPQVLQLQAQQPLLHTHCAAIPQAARCPVSTSCSTRSRHSYLQ